MAPRAPRSTDLVRPLTSRWGVVLASATALAVAGAVLSSALAQTFRERALDDNARGAVLYANSVLAPAVVRGGRIVATPRARRRLARSAAETRELIGFSLWARDGRLVFSTIPGRIPKDRVALAAALRGDQTRARVEEIARRQRGGRRELRRSVVAWAPLRGDRGRPVGAAQVALRPAAFDTSVATTTRTIRITVGLVLLVSVLAFLLLAAGVWLSRRRELDPRARDLIESSRRLEESLLETIETLNAAVEARDPYTAGHSQRVRRVALAIGRELSFPAKQLGALGTAALFHDVGKIGIPDSILTKTGPLEPAEAAVMREHVTRGAEIAAKVSSFQDAVPAIRHHHERWDGLGYPDGLRGEEIPLEAAIIGLADAWDAMTTDRPYAHGLSLNDAMLQIRAGREKQFSPAVVDAFWQVAKRRPSEVLPPEAPSATVAAV
jgi:putative nucleotidyltransferase with HDIG domain